MKQWSYFQNPFLNAVKRNYKQALHISTFTDARLQAKGDDAFYQSLYNMYHPLHVNFLDAYNIWKLQGGVQKGATLTLDQLLKLLSPAKINAWDLAVMNVYAKGSPEYVTIFPQGHKPFQTGQKDQRINAVKQLKTALTGKVELATTLDDITAFYNQLLNASNAQQGEMGNKGSLSDLVMEAMTTALTAMYSILGKCMAEFPADPSVCEYIFDLATIRDHEQLVYTGRLDPQENHNVLEHTFVSTDQPTLGNTGSTVIQYFLAATANAPLNGSPVIAVNPDERKTILASELGNLSNRFLHVINTSTNAEGHFKLELE
jgi:hypothetical protein